ILAYNYHLIGSALSLIVHSAFHPTAMAGGIIGFSVQQAMRFGILRAILATESGLGTAAIMFSATGSREPAKEAILSMLSTFISSLVCFMIALCIVITGVWDSGLTSTALTIAAYKTVFGVYGGWIVSFLSISFGIGVLVSFAYIAQESWSFLFGNGLNWLFNVVYCAIAFGAVFVNVNALWALIDIVTVGMFVINLVGILYLLPLVQRGIAAFDAVEKR
ncbi:MAG TPA: alanine:cation symporter family protein, partial [Candidatus Babeliales bacterium]|nr:alanine:cation symporter family protein [Candidatus Babeliales bacterium]